MATVFIEILLQNEWKFYCLRQFSNIYLASVPCVYLSLRCRNARFILQPLLSSQHSSGYDRGCYLRHISGQNSSPFLFRILHHFFLEFLTISF